MNMKLKIAGSIFLICILYFGINFFARYINTSKWVNYENKQGRFRIEFPNKPIEIDKLVNSPNGELLAKIFIYDASKNKDDNLSYNISYVDYPDSLVDCNDKEWCLKFFDNLNKRSVNSLHGKLEHVTIDSIEKYPMQEIKVSFKDGQALYREENCLVKNRLYSMSVITESKYDFNKSIDHFFNTFKLLR